MVVRDLLTSQLPGGSAVPGDDPGLDPEEQVCPAGSPPPAPTRRGGGLSGQMASPLTRFLTEIRQSGLVECGSGSAWNRIYFHHGS